MQILLPSDVESRLTPKSAALHLAIGMFVGSEATLGQAAAVAQIPQAEFLKELGNRRISPHYGMEELTEDLRVIDSLSAK